MGWVAGLSIFTIMIVLCYQRASALVWSVALGVTLLVLTLLQSVVTPTVICLWIGFFSIQALLYIAPLRYFLFSRHVLRFYKKNMPTMSRTEREALNAGTVSWEGE